jgi:ubiquinone/menaquinone biosynthesis C-methylase UbiE
MISDLLDGSYMENILEVGIGSGIFILEMLKHADRVVGIDLRSSYDGVYTMLRREQVDIDRVELRQGNIFNIPYEDQHFNAVVCISVLEHFTNPQQALIELKRVVKSGGNLFLGFPARNLLTNWLFRLLGYNAADIHPASHDTILAAISEVLSIDEIMIFPSAHVPLYVACRATRE